MEDKSSLAWDLIKDRDALVNRLIKATAQVLSYITAAPSSI